MIILNLSAVRYLVLAFVVGLAFGCTEAPDSPEAESSEVVKETMSERPPESAATMIARMIIQEAIAASGLEGMNEAAFSFRFRDKEYRYQRTQGTYAYERWWTDSTTNKVIRDVLSNEGLVRYTDGKVTDITDKNRKAYGESVNSVIYFAFMPWVLQDPAVIPTYLGQDTIKGEVLDQLDISFALENGGADSGDAFRYWFTPDTRQLKYIAYNEPGGKSPRLRVAHNERQEAGITVRDYHNYNTPGNEPMEVGGIIPAFESGKLKLLSEIDLEEVKRLKIREDRKRGDAVIGE